MKKKELNVYLKRKDIILEGTTGKWDIGTHGEIQGTYSGTFVFKCFLTPTEKLAAGRTYRELLGPNAALALSHEDQLAFALAQLKYRIITAPPFWGSSLGIDGVAGDIPDENIISVILDAALSCEFKYLAELRNKKDEAIQRAKAAAEKQLAEKDKDQDEDDDDEEQD